MDTLYQFYSNLFSRKYEKKKKKMKCLSLVYTICTEYYHLTEFETISIYFTEIEKALHHKIYYEQKKKTQQPQRTFYFFFFIFSYYFEN